MRTPWQQQPWPTTVFTVDEHAFRAGSHVGRRKRTNRPDEVRVRHGELGVVAGGLAELGPAVPHWARPRTPG
ncbi:MULTISPECIES: hypothetical protein [Streptomyces]|uniref:Transposase n=1 Tax=Streptomyces canarius TaxID=285453 RepID=A0ABQ3D4D7_9ACTN|nr:hypothetical protein [Streptomyces canarius]GHA56948.1 hypothetical protein GCM10010345_71850 [Streptomyces canarius]